MNITDLIPELLIVLDLQKDSVVGTNTITAYQVIKTLLIEDTCAKAAASLGISPKTLLNIYTPLFLGVDAGSKHKKKFLLDLVGYKQCTRCDKLAEVGDFVKDRSLCRVCSRNLQAKYASTPKAKRLGLTWRKKNRKHLAQANKVWYQENKARKNASDKAWRQTPQGKACECARTAKRRAAKISRTPKWVDHPAINQIYANCPSGQQVDHIIPLQGGLVSGLHIAENLQYLTASENLAKSNKFIV